MASVCSRASLDTRAGLPSRTTLNPAALRRSTRLSTAALDGACGLTSISLQVSAAVSAHSENGMKRLRRNTWPLTAHSTL